MGTIIKRGELQWQAKVRRKGFPAQSRTFMYKDDAEKWVRTVERELETAGFIDRRQAEKTTLASILRRYQQEITPTKKSGEIESIKIDVLLRDKAIAGLKMTAITSSELVKWRDRRLKAVTGGTVNRELDILSSVLNHARREWGIHVENPVPYVKRPEKARSRERRLSTLEESYLLAALTGGERTDNGTFSKGARNPWLLPFVQLALETAMRRGELFSLQWENIDLERRTAHLPDTKNGDARTVPLSTRAVTILGSLPSSPRSETTRAGKHAAGPVFCITAAAFKKGFTRAMERAQETYAADCRATNARPVPGFLDDLRFHDMRHEAASRLADKLTNVLELSAVTGHRDIRMLKRYYHPRAEDLAKKLG
ncbi:site-specific integrase [Achromobacter dolens]|uniref:site-specific integrase n=1 Tax=Achromobacter dolens TaxID=1287738 RepID=UPI003556AE4C